MKVVSNMLELLFEVGVYAKLEEVPKNRVADYYVLSNQRFYRVFDKIQEVQGKRIYGEIDNLKRSDLK